MVDDATNPPMWPASWLALDDAFLTEEPEQLVRYNRVAFAREVVLVPEVLIDAPRVEVVDVFARVPASP